MQSSMRQRQAKLLALGAVIRSGAATSKTAMLRSLTAEVLCLREKSEIDTVDNFFILSALSQVCHDSLYTCICIKYYVL